jgi:Putative Flp pilus-assembly TadE/G-like
MKLHPRSEPLPRSTSAGAVFRGRSQRGSVIIFVAVSLAACLAFAVLAIDVGAIFVTKVQLQNAADAAALAGASALLNDDQAEATTRAITVAGENMALQDGPAPVVISEDDVTFPTASRCRVVTHRTEATGDPLRTFFSPIVGVTDRLAQVTADAEAEYYLICGTDCVKPWSIPDRWQDLDGDGEFDYGEPYTDGNANDQWDMGEPYEDLNGDGQYTPDEPYDPVSTGYLPPADVGIRLMLKSGSPHDAIVPSFYYAVCLPPLHSPEGPPESGGSVYEWNIANCNASMVNVGDSLQVEPGNMQGPTNHGVADLLAQDPDAYWDSGSQTVQGSNYGTSPRVVKVAFFDPRVTPKSGRNFVIVSKMSAMFVEGLGPQNSVVGVFMGLGTQGTPCEGGEPGFLTGLRLVE